MAMAMALCLMPMLAPAQTPAPAPKPAAARAEAGPAWSRLSAAQRSALAPLQRDWAGIDGPRKTKWLEVAARFPGLPPLEQQRIHARMAEWARLTPAERGAARLQFQETRQQMGSDQRQERWQAYQALPESQRRELALRAHDTAATAAVGQPARPATPAAAAARPQPVPRGKDNTVTAQPASPVRSVTPVVVQVRPGATTTMVSTPAARPAHHQPGMSKIAASEGFVDPRTMLPRRGPQGAAVIASQPPARPASAASAAR